MSNSQPQPHPQATADTLSSQASNATSDITRVTALKRNSKDVGWNFAVFSEPGNPKGHLKCLKCNKVMKGGGINRVKHHIAGLGGIVEACPNATDEDKALCRVALAQPKEKKNKKHMQEAELRAQVSLPIQDEEDEVTIVAAKRKKEHLGPIDRFTSTINVEPSVENTKAMYQQNIKDALDKERTHSVHQYLARWVYEAGIPFHAIDNDGFKRFVEAVGQYGPGYRPPSQYQLREPLLKDEVERTKESLKKQEEEWALNGCSIMTDAWSDRKRRSIMNLCVNCKEGTTFLSSKEVSDEAHTGLYIFEYVDKCIEDVGPANVIQVVTDNASNNMAAAKMLKEKRPHMFWTSCATHTINLMLQAIGNEEKFKGTIERAKQATIFLYAHHRTLALMRKYTKKVDIVRPGVTRFASTFLTLQSMLEKKSQLGILALSDEWAKCNHTKSPKGKATKGTLLSPLFWNHVTLCLKVFTPLVKVLRLVDGDRKPSMGFLYGELKRARNEIKETFKNNEVNYSPILKIVDAKASGRLDSPLHLAAYFLNPYYYFKDQDIPNNDDVMIGVMDCVEHHFFHDNVDLQYQVLNVELPKYRNKEGAFSRNVAILGCANNDENFDPVSWWYNYGTGVPNLQRMAVRILSLTTSSSGCERNWSAFEGIHTKKRNRLDASRMNSLVYVQFNARLLNKQKRLREKKMDALLAVEASKAQEWLAEGYVEPEICSGGESSDVISQIPIDVGGVGGVGEVRDVRELYEEDFVSEDEGEYRDDENVDWESDYEGVIDGFGEEFII